MDSLRKNGAASGGVGDADGRLLRGRLVENLSQLLVVDSAYEPSHRFAPDVDDHPGHVEYEVPPGGTGHPVEVYVEHLHVGIAPAQPAHSGTQAFAEGTVGPSKVKENPVPGENAVFDVADGFSLVHRPILPSRAVRPQGHPDESRPTIVDGGNAAAV